ncbi:uncharacterized protein [Littorina saxatilis]|uniref:uncharacterized protein n=1 Tax=Littorina saxatilis TaxID=31220 RepID=UPI0038B4AD5D
MAATSTQATETEDDGKKHYDKFLDDPYNMAMYVVLPTMVFIYGGCCFIYCMAKCNRYCRRKARRRARQQLIQKDDQNDSDDGNDNNKKKKGGHINAVCKETGTISVVDLTDPEIVKAPPRITAPKPAPRPAPKPTAPNLALTPNPATPNPVAPCTPRTERTNASSRVPSSGVEPGYTKANSYGGNLQQQMQHLDDQLKAAFKLISDEPKKVKSRPDVCAKSDENKKPVKKRDGSKMRFLVSDQ